MSELGFERAAGKGGGRYQGDDEVSVIQGSVVEVDEDVVVAKSRNLSFVVPFKAVETGWALDGPLLRS